MFLSRLFQLITLLIIVHAFSSCDAATWEALAKSLDEYNQQQNTSSSSLAASAPGKGSASYQVSSIVEFNWLKGNYEWIAASKQRLLNSQFLFKSDGTFVYVLPYDNTTTYYLYGSWYTSSEGIRMFEGSTSSNNGAGSGTKILCSGQVYPYGAQMRAVISYASAANYYAKVDNAEFVNNASKQFNAKVVVTN